MEVEEVVVVQGVLIRSVMSVVSLVILLVSVACVVVQEDAAAAAAAAVLHNFAGAQVMGEG